MSRSLYFRMGNRRVRLVLDDDFEESPLYAEAYDPQSREIIRDNRLIERILSGDFAEPIDASEYRRQV